MGPRFGVSPAALAMVRILGGALVFVPALLASGRPRIRSFRDAGELAVLGLFGVVLNQALFLAGLRQTSPVSATLLVATIPIFTAAIGALAGRRDRLTAREAAPASCWRSWVSASSPDLPCRTAATPWCCSTPRHTPRTSFSRSGSSPGTAP